MAPTNVTAFKGTSLESDRRVYQIDPMQKLSTVRDKLTKDGFLPADKENEIGYRFVVPTSESTTFRDAVLAKGTENYVPLAGVLGGANQLICTNIWSTKKPDLVGIRTTWFFNRYLGVNIGLNNSDEEGRKTNASIGAFDPLMLTNVKPTSEKVVGIWDNVCVCIENSVVSFNLSSWGSAGYELYIAQEQGGAIVDGGLYVCNAPVPDRYLGTTISRYRDKPQTIQIVSARSQGISGSADVLRFQKVTFKTRRITSYEQNGNTFASNTAPPTRSGPAGLEGFDAELADAAADFQNQRSLANAKGITTLPGDSIEPGGAVEGPKSQQNWGGPIRKIQKDDWSQALGEVVVYFFVFKSKEQAERVINGYNAPDPSLWS